MSDEPYFKLREFLDQFPIGFPQTDSGVEIKILKRLFSEEEAEITIQLAPLPEQAAARWQNHVSGGSVHDRSLRILGEENRS
jgi:hypothetical protein